MSARKPLPWSHSALEDFVNCPKAFFEKRVIKSVKDEDNEHNVWGLKVHKAFEDRQKDGTKLPPELAEHERFMSELEAMPGKLFAERKVALNTQAEPCEFFGKRVWWRGVIDWTKIHGSARTAFITDYKTGKMHSKFKQLKLFAVYTFAEYADIDTVKVKYYWTKTAMTTGETYHREQIPELWAEFFPDLRQYVSAFKQDEWPAKQSGLCRGWCPVKTCEFWTPRRK